MTDKELFKQYHDSAPQLDAAFFLTHATHLAADEVVLLERLSTSPVKAKDRKAHYRVLCQIQDAWRRRKTD